MTDRTITWLPMPEHHNYGAAEDYLRVPAVEASLREH